jgi:hypothetical protein
MCPPRVLELSSALAAPCIISAHSILPGAVLAATGGKADAAPSMAGESRVGRIPNIERGGSRERARRGNRALQSAREMLRGQALWPVASCLPAECLVGK